MPILIDFFIKHMSAYTHTHMHQKYFFLQNFQLKATNPSTQPIITVLDFYYA